MKVLAVLVTFHPDLEVLRQQVDLLRVTDPKSGSVTNLPLNILLMNQDSLPALDMVAQLAKAFAQNW
jgi:hypothetical protein